MAQLLQLAAILGLSLALTNGADAKGPGGNKGGQNSSHAHSSNKNYRQTHGRAFSGGYRFDGRDHRHWTRWNWDSRYGCYQYWCPYSLCYYYWCAPQNCYFPVSCINQYPPTQVAYSPSSPGVPPLPLVQVTNINQNSLANGAPTGPMSAVAPNSLPAAPISASLANGPTGPMGSPSGR